MEFKSLSVFHMRMGKGANERGFNDTKKRIYKYLTENPGAGFSQIMRDMNIGNGTTQYGIEGLEYHNLVERKHEGRLVRFYALEDKNGILYAEKPRRHRIGGIPTESPSEF